MKPLISCEHVDFGYESHDAVRDLTMQIGAGDYLCIVGANGSGKSTLVKGLLGLLKPTGGTLSISEELRRGGIGYLPQQTVSQKDFPATVREVVMSGFLNRMGNRPFYRRQEKEEALDNLGRLGIRELAGRCYRELSGGQQQRVLIARALCSTRRLMILDEPVTGLDPSAIQEFYGILQGLNQEGVAIVMVSHDIQNVLRFANRVLHLDQRVLYYGDAQGYAASPASRMFLGDGPDGREEVEG